LALLTGANLNQTLPTILSALKLPHSRESYEASRLSPITKYSPAFSLICILPGVLK